MMAALWSDIASDIASAKRHFGEAVALYGGPLEARADYVTSMAFQHAMQAGYTSFEAGMKRLLHMLGEPMPYGPDSHAALTRRIASEMTGERPAVIVEPLLGQIEELRRFRHVAMHAYDDFTPAKARLPVEAAQGFVAGIDAAIATFRSRIDPS